MRFRVKALVAVPVLVEKLNMLPGPWASLFLAEEELAA